MGKDKESLSQLEKDLLAKQQGSGGSSGSAETDQGTEGQLSRMEQDLLAKQRVGAFAVGSSSEESGRPNESDISRLSRLEQDLMTKQPTGSPGATESPGRLKQDVQGTKNQR